MLNKKNDRIKKEIEIVENHKNEKFVFNLFINGSSIISTRTIHNALDIFEKYLKGRYELKIIDASKEKSAVLKEHIIALPVLIKKQPFPEIRLLGDLSDTQKVIRDLLIN